MELREQIAELISTGFQARNGIAAEVADWHAQNLIEQLDRSRICPNCGAAMDEVVAVRACSPA